MWRRKLHSRMRSGAESCVCLDFGSLSKYTVLQGSRGTECNASGRQLSQMFNHFNAGLANPCSPFEVRAHMTAEAKFCLGATREWCSADQEYFQLWLHQVYFE